MILKKIILILVLFFSHITYANLLDQQINDFFYETLGEDVDSIHVNYQGQALKLSCDVPNLSFLRKSKKWGKVTIIAMCDNKKYFIPLDVQVTGKYIVANRNISTGDIISENDIKLISGRLDKLSDPVLLKREQIINYVASRNININELIKNSMLRKNWQIKLGETVKVIVNGNGYKISTEGKSLMNGTLGDNINVRVNSGKIVTGVVTNNGIEIFNKNN